MDPETRNQIERGKRITEALKQPPFSPVPLTDQVATLWAVTNGHMDEIEVTKIQEFVAHFLSHLKMKYKKVMDEVADKKIIEDSSTKALEDAVAEALKTFKPGTERVSQESNVKSQGKTNQIVSKTPKGKGKKK